MISWFKSIFNAPQLDQDLTKLPRIAPNVLDVDAPPRDPNQTISYSKNYGEELRLFYELFALSSTRCWDFKNKENVAEANKYRRNPKIYFQSGKDAKAKYRVNITLKEYNHEITYDYLAYENYPSKEKHLEFSGYEWLVELIKHQREYIKTHGVKPSYFQNYLDWGIVNIDDVPDQIHSKERFFQYGDDCILSIDPVSTIGMWYERYYENGVGYIKTRVFSMCDEEEHLFLSRPHERLMIESIRSHWIDEAINTNVLKMKKHDEKIILHMKRVFDMWQKYHDSAKHVGGLLPTPITNYESYCEFCDCVDIEKSGESFRINNYLRNVGKYENN